MAPSNRDSNRYRTLLVSAGIVLLFGLPLLGGMLAVVLGEGPMMGVGMPLAWGFLSLAFGVQAAGDYWAAASQRERSEESDNVDENSSCRRAA